MSKETKGWGEVDFWGTEKTETQDGVQISSSIAVDSKQIKRVIKNNKIVFEIFHIS